MTKEEVEALGYIMARQLADGRWIALQPQIYTVGLFVGITDLAYERRYCYASTTDAAVAALRWDGVGDPPGPWVKEKPSDRLGPGAT